MTILRFDMGEGCSKAVLAVRRGDSLLGWARQVKAGKKALWEPNQSLREHYPGLRPSYQNDQDLTDHITSLERLKQGDRPMLWLE